tara:strand:- start:682 stop:1434 length:753 start_codon:yes stop_codon:yes gene_type:complete
MSSIFGSSGYNATQTSRAKDASTVPLLGRTKRGPLVYRGYEGFVNFNLLRGGFNVGSTSVDESTPGNSVPVLDARGNPIVVGIGECPHETIIYPLKPIVWLQEDGSELTLNYSDVSAPNYAANLCFRVSLSPKPVEFTVPWTSGFTYPASYGDFHTPALETTQRISWNTGTQSGGAQIAPGSASSSLILTQEGYQNLVLTNITGMATITAPLPQDLTLRTPGAASIANPVRGYTVGSGLLAVGFQTVALE